MSLSIHNYMQVRAIGPKAVKILMWNPQSVLAAFLRFCCWIVGHNPWEPR